MTVRTNSPVAIFPRYRLEEGLVNIQAASDEASAQITRGWNSLPRGARVKGTSRDAFAAADALVRLIGFEAHRMAGEVSTCPDALIEPGHGSAA